MTASPSTAPRGAEIARLWSEAPALMPHSAGCSCAGHVALHLDPKTVEADILDYLAVRYAGEPELGRFVAERAGSRGITFATWLGDLDRAPLSAAASDRLRTDLATTISSLAAA